jgi:hypothetical protein
MVYGDGNINIKMILAILFPFPGLMMVTADHNHTWCSPEPFPVIYGMGFCQAFLLLDNNKMPGLEVNCGWGNATCFQNKFQFILFYRSTIVITAGVT